MSRPLVAGAVPAITTIITVGSLGMKTHLCASGDVVEFRFNV